MIELLVGHVGCIDEDLDTPGEKDTVDCRSNVFQLDFGLAGSGVVQRGTGDEWKLPDQIRLTFQENQGGVLWGLRNIVRSLGGVMYVSSHAGCGWAGLQNIVDVAQATANMCATWEVGYAGHVVPGESPVQIGDSPVMAYMGRPEHVHHHGASTLIVTTGGGITGAELYAKTVQAGYGDGFKISADFAAEAVAHNWMSAETAIAIVAAQLDLADGLADRRIGVGRMFPFNAGRLSSEQADYNQWVFDQAVASLNG